MNEATNKSSTRKVANKKPKSFDRGFKKTDTLVYALGGLGEVGKNMYCIEHDNEIIIIDCGVIFPDDELLGVDYVIPDYTYLIQNAKKIKALVITHGHEDHIGGIPFFLQSIPLKMIYAPRFACALIRKKLDERRMSKSVKLIEVDSDSKVQTQHFSLGFFDTIHSTPDSLGVLINTPNGRVVHTGDFKFDLSPVQSNADYQKMAYIGQIGVTLLLSDSTNSAVTGFSISEKKVAKSLLDIARRIPGRLIVATFASNVYRVQQIIEAAIQCDRKIIIFGRSMENVVDVGRKMGIIKAKESNFIKPEQLRHTPANKVCLICTGSQGEPLAALSRIAAGTHRYVSIQPGDSIVFSSSPIPGNANSVTQVVNKLTRAGADVMINSPLTSLHTTGHASQDEQKLMLQLIKPSYFMPVHGEYKMQKLHALSSIETGIPAENNFICSNGDVVIMRDEHCFLSEHRIQTDDVYVDGNDTSGLSTAVIRDRHILAESGLVSVIVTIDSRYNKVLCRPSIVSRGFVYIKENQPLLKEAELIVYEALKKKMQQRTTFGELKNCIRGALEPFLYKRTNRNPIVIPVILNQKAAMIQNPQKKTTQRPRKNNQKPKKTEE